jgi:hypothetical protein
MTDPVLTPSQSLCRRGADLPRVVDDLLNF